MTPSVSGTEQYCYKGKVVRARRNGIKYESTVFFRNFCERPKDFCRLLQLYTTGRNIARRKNVLSQSAYLFTLSNYQSNHAKDNRK